MSTNEDKRAQEVAGIEWVCNMITSAQSTVIESEYQMLDDAIAKGRQMRADQSVKSQHNSKIYSQIKDLEKGLK